MLSGLDCFPVSLYFVLLPFEEAEEPVGDPRPADVRRGSVILGNLGTAVEREIDK